MTKQSTKQTAIATPPRSAETGAPPKRGKRKIQPTLATPELLKTRLMLRVREFSELTATPVATVYSLLYAGKIAGAIRIGESWRIPVKTLRDQIASGGAA